MKFISGIKYLLALVTWAVFIGLGFLFLLLSRNAFTGLLTMYYADNKFQRLKEVQFLDQIYLLIIGIGLFVFIIIVEEYLRLGARRNRLTGRILRVIGIELIVFFVAHLAFAFLVGFATQTMIALAVEATAGVLMTAIGFRIPVK